MSPHRCEECSHLHQKTAEAISLELEANTRYLECVQDGGPESQAELQRCREARLEAIRRYENHIAAHGLKSMTAGFSQSE